jgi:hypothetical protein
MLRTKFSIQEHYRKKNRSSHFDLRVMNPEKTRLWSWAFPKARFPEFGEKLLAIRTPNHKIGYMLFQGHLSNGDTVKVFDAGWCDILIDKSYFKVIHFHGKKIKDAYNFIEIVKTKNEWLVTKSKKY